ncbi:MAG: carboxypeptidase regulatory-like domain-containing protein [Planctomycetes bacterium]|nr:carboxypeptidase regulatory-like domain-containing protein [Planctomycetota bacterium]
MVIALAMAILVIVVWLIPFGIALDSPDRSGLGAPPPSRVASASQATKPDEPGAGRHPSTVAAVDSEFTITCIDEVGAAAPFAELAFRGPGVDFHRVADEVGRSAGQFSAEVLYIYARSKDGGACASDTIRRSRPEDRTKTIRLVSSASVSVTVRDALGHATAGCRVELAIAGVSAEARGIPKRPDPVVTDTNGSARFLVDGFGYYTAMAKGPLGHDSTRAQVQVRPGVTTEVEVYIGLDIRIGGRVVDRSGQPVVGARVVAQRHRVFLGQCEQRTAGTGSRGEFEIALPGPGRYSVAAVHDGFALVAAVECQADFVESPKDLTLVMAPAERLAGRVLDRVGSPVSGVPVRMEIAPSGDPVSPATELATMLMGTDPKLLLAKSGVDGRFEFSRAPAFCGKLVLATEAVVDGMAVVGRAEIDFGADGVQGDIVLPVDCLVGHAGRNDVAIVGGQGLHRVVLCKRSGPGWVAGCQQVAEVVPGGTCTLDGAVVTGAVLVVGDGLGRVVQGGDLIRCLQEKRLEALPVGKCTVHLAGVVDSVAWLATAKVIANRVDGVPLPEHTLVRVGLRDHSLQWPMPGQYVVTVLDGWRVRGCGLVEVGASDTTVNVLCQ